MAAQHAADVVTVELDEDGVIGRGESVPYARYGESVASVMDEIEAMLAAAGFVDIRIQPKDASREFIHNWVPGRNAGDYVVSSTIEAVKPGTAAACCSPSCCA